MQEIHAVANGDGTYTAVIITVMNGVPYRYVAERVLIQTENLVADEQQGGPAMRFTFTQQGM